MRLRPPRAKKSRMYGRITERQMHSVRHHILSVSLILTAAGLTIGFEGTSTALAFSSHSSESRSSSPSGNSISSSSSSASPASPSSSSTDSATKELGNSRGGYPRVIRLSSSGAANGELIAAVTLTNTAEAIFRSTDDGTSFKRVGSVTAPAGMVGDCCGSLYELPRAIGTLNAGTLLFAASYGHYSQPMSILLYASNDQGSTWYRVSAVVNESAPSSQGIWEPEMHIDKAGQLVVYFSDETQPGHSQALMERVSTNGSTWSRSIPVVELADPTARPGMAVVRALPNGTLFMTYEVWGGDYNGDVHYRTSTDGLHWGDPAWPGNPVIANNGDFLSATPTTTVVDDGQPGGEIILTGHFYKTSENVPATGTGDTILVNFNGGNGPWIPELAPVSVKVGAAKCANYSSSLLSVENGKRLLEIAQVKADSTTGCSAYYATEPMPTDSR